MRVSLTKQAACWHNFVKKDNQLRKTLIKDIKMCRLILSNKKVFSEFEYFSGKAHPKFTATVSNKHVDTTETTKYRYWSNTYCHGENKPGYLAYEVKQMTHLSQFLMTYSAWLAKKNE